MDLAPFWSVWLLFLSFPFISERKPTKTDSNHGFGSVLIRLAAFPFISFHFGKETHQNGFKSWIWLRSVWFSFPFISERKPTKTDSNHGFGSVLIRLAAFPFISFHFGKETHQNGLKSWIWLRFDPFGCFSFHFLSFPFISFHFGKETHQNGLKSWIWLRFDPFGCFSFHFLSFRKGNPPKRIQIMDLAPFWSVWLLFFSFPFISDRKLTKTDSNHGFGSVLIRLAAFPFISFHFGKETHQNGLKSWIWLRFDPFGCFSFHFLSFPFISERKPIKTDSNHGFGSVLIRLAAFPFISFHFLSFRKGNPPKRILSLGYPFSARFCSHQSENWLLENGASPLKRIMRSQCGSNKSGIRNMKSFCSWLEQKNSNTCFLFFVPICFFGWRLLRAQKSVAQDLPPALPLRTGGDTAQSCRLKNLFETWCMAISNRKDQPRRLPSRYTVFASNNIFKHVESRYSHWRKSVRL